VIRQAGSVLHDRTSWRAIEIVPEPTAVKVRQARVGDRIPVDTVRNLLPAVIRAFDEFVTGHG
jgi:hypothetical protein